MRQYKHILSILFLILLLTACHKKEEVRNDVMEEVDNSINDLDEYLHSDDEMWLSVLKFTKPEYKDNILAWNRTELNGNIFSVCLLPESEKEQYIKWWEQNRIKDINPFIELGNDYLLIDWHWKPLFIYLNTDTYNANLGQILLNDVKWSELENLNSEWDINSISYSFDVIDEIHQFKIKAIDDYRGDTQYSTTEWEQHLYHIATNKYSDLTQNQEQQIDSLQTIYTECLKSILQTNSYTENDAYITNIK